MRPSIWHPPIELSSLEQTIIARMKRAKLFVFLGSLTETLSLMTLSSRELAALSAPSLSFSSLPFRQRNWPRELAFLVENSVEQTPSKTVYLLRLPS
jgi:hypothetical protein